MLISCFIRAIIIILPLAVVLSAFSAQDMVSASNISIVLGANASKMETQVAEVLAERLQWHSQISVEVVKESAPDAGLQIYLGKTGHDGELDKLCNDHGVELPGRNRPAPEGYVVKSLRMDNANVILAMGADDRGILYAAGEILRQIQYKPYAISFEEFHVSAAPAFRFRGASAAQGGTMMRATGARGWTGEEWKRVIMDYALAGANCFYAGWGKDDPGFHYMKSFDLMTESGIRPNEMRDEFPEEWRAGGLARWEGTHWVCPNIPEAREALLEMWKEKFETRDQHDVMRMYAGDPGGCRDERCAPWGKTFVHLCQDVANILLETHPDTIIMVANQDLSNEGDQAVFDYLNEEPREWLYGMTYGPGSNAMSRYFRKELREDLFEYPGKGPVNRYLAETLNQIPRDKKIVHYSDITHWISSQYAVKNPEPNVIKAYGRRTFHARPRAFYRIFQAIMPFSEGDIIYSEGYHDEFHQYMWYRLLWNPNRELGDIMREYCRFQFGQEAAELMVEALLQLEENLEAPLATNDGIDRYYALVKEAGNRIPPHLMAKNHRWRLHMQKAALDKYNQLKLRQELSKEERVRNLLGAALGSGELGEALEQALAITSEPTESPEMMEYREEAGQLGEESGQLFGVRNIGYFKLERPLRNLPGQVELLENAKAAESDEEKKQIIAEVIEKTRERTRSRRW